MHTCLWRASARFVRSLSLFVVALVSWGVSSAEVAGTALTNRVNGLSGRIEGSVQQNQAGGVTFNGGAVVTGDLLVRIERARLWRL